MFLLHYSESETVLSSHKGLASSALASVLVQNTQDRPRSQGNSSSEVRVFDFTLGNYCGVADIPGVCSKLSYYYPLPRGKYFATVTT